MIYPELRFRPKARVVDDAQIAQLHSATLEVLERTGVRLTHPKGREILQGAGARIEGDRVRIPSFMVEEALRRAPKHVVLGKRNGERSLFLENDNVYYGPSVDCIEYLNPTTSERRPFVTADCRITSTVADACANFDWVMTIGMAADVSPHTADRHIAKQVFANTEKPLVFCCKDTQSTSDIYEMAKLVMGGEKAFEQAPNIVHYSEPVSPLVHYDPAIDKLIFCASKNIPLVYYPAPMFGGTAPASLAGVVVEGSAESLSGLVLAQLVRPGSPYIFGSFATVIDMSTTIFSYGAPEMSMMVGAQSQLAQFYGLPFFGTAGCSDAKFPDAQAAAEAAFSCLSSALIGGANMVHDSGWLDHGCIASPAHIVLVNEILHMVKRYMKGLPINDESLAVELIDKVGPGGHFMNEEHTMSHFRDVWYSRLFDRTIFAQWVERGSKRFEERLQEMTEKVMKHQPAPLAPEVVKELDAMASRWQ